MQEAAHHRFQSANLAALHELQKAVAELTTASQQKQAQILQLAKQSAEQGIGDNDLKRLKRQFDSNKATFVNIDQKQRFMDGLVNLELDIEQLTEAKDQAEQQLDKEAEAVRSLKAQNAQARTDLASTSASIGQLYGLVEAAAAAAAAQLDTTAAVLQQAAASRPAGEEEALEPGPGQVEAQQLVEAETARARELERSIAEAEALLSELDATAAADRHKLAALQAEVEQLEAAASQKAEAADADSAVKDMAQWCEAMLELGTSLGGLAVLEAGPQQLLLELVVRAPMSRPAAADAVREVRHELAIQLQQQQPGPCVVRPAAAKLSPSCIDISDIVEAAATAEGLTDLEPLSMLVREVRGRLVAYWQRQVLVEAAAEVFPPVSSSLGPPHVRSQLPHQTEVEVLVPLSWPAVPGTQLQLVQLSSPELSAEGAAELCNGINGDGPAMEGCDLLSLLESVAKAVEAHVLDAAAA